MPAESSAINKSTENDTGKRDAEPSNLSSYVFQNPQEFLQTLKDNWQQMDASGKDSLGKGDFLLFSTESTDPKARAAAGIAYAHFDELKVLDQNSSGNPGNKQGISLDDIETDLSLAPGELNGTIKHNQNAAGDLAVGEAALAAGSAALMVGGVMSLDPLMAVGGASAFVPMAIFAISDYLEWQSAADILTKASANEQKVLSSWKEINGASD